jgi:Tyrosine phosphatase family
VCARSSTCAHTVRPPNRSTAWPACVSPTFTPPDFPFPIPLADGYQRILDEHARAVGAVLRSVADAGPGAVLFHCHSGTGRTGLLTLLLLSIAGVPPPTIQSDYLMSHRPGQVPAGAGAVIPSTLRHLDARYGGPAGYLTPTLA